MSSHKSKSGPCRVVARFEPVQLTPEQQVENERWRKFALEQKRINKDLWYATHPEHRRREVRLRGS